MASCDLAATDLADIIIYLHEMHPRHLGFFVLIAFGCSQAYWHVQRDTPSGWTGEFALLPSDTADRILGIQELAIPQVGTPAVRARFLPQDTSKASSIAVVQSIHTWNGARILHMDIKLSSAQRHSPALSRAKVRLEVAWSGSQTFPLPPLVVNTIGNPIGGARFGSTPNTARRLAASPSLPALPTGPVAALTVGDVSKQTHHQVSRTDENGVVRLKVSDLKRVLGNLDGTSLRNIAVYRGPRDTLPSVSGNITAPTLVPVKLERIAKNPDQLADDDEVRFYVEGTTIWIRDSTAPCGSGWKQSISPYSLTRKYLIALQPDSKAGQPASQDRAKLRVSISPKSFATVQQTWRDEQHILLKNHPIDSGSEFDDTKTGTNWFWFGTTEAKNSIPSSLTLTGLASDSLCAEVSLAQGSTDANSSLNSNNSLALNGTALTRQIASNQSSGFWSGRGLKNSGNQLVLNTSADRRFQGYALHGWIKPRLENGRVEFPTPSAGALSVPFLAPSSSDSLIGYALEDGEISRRVQIVREASYDSLPFQGYRLTDSASSLATRYVVTFAANLLAPTSLSWWQSRKLAVTDFSAESGDSMLVITVDSFLVQADAFAKYRSQQSLVRKIPTRVVRLEDIYQLYAGGQSDPTAIRDFLRWAKANWGTSHVLLLGHGHYDFRNLHGAGMANIVPTWEVMNYATDNYFVYLDSAEWDANIHSRTVDIAIGRIPAHNSAEFDAWFGKLKAFEAIQPNQDPSWRNTAYLVADDFMKWGAIDIIKHSEQTEELALLLQSTRPWLYQDNLYMAKFLPNASREKPDVRRAIIGRLDQGVSLFNYIGHGAEGQLAHERVFDLNAVNSLSNSAKPFLFFAAGCSVGRFDHTGASPLGSTIVTTPGKGAMASISATRSTFPDPNSVLNKEFFGRIYSLNAQTCTIGEALAKARNATIPSDYGPAYKVTNQDAYVLMGDPSMAFAPTGLQMSFTGLPDTLKALSQIAAKATYSSSNPTTAVLRFLNSPVQELLTNNETSCPSCVATVTQTRKQILSSSSNGNGGNLTFDAFVPAKLNFGDVVSYSTFGIDTKTGLMGGYSRDSILMSGTDPNANLKDDQGPQVSFRPCDSAYSAGEPFIGTAKIPLPFCLQVQMFDSAGISSSSSPDEGVIVNVPGVLDTWRPELQTGSSFRQTSFQVHFDSSSYKTGATYALGILAHDQMGNYTRAQLNLEVQDPGTTGLYDVFNRPNPVKTGSSTTFYFKVSTSPDANSTVPASIQASIRIHTLSGKLIKVLRTDLTQTGNILPRAVWDLHDDFGNAVANGLYPYTVKLRVPSTKGGKWTQTERKGVVAISR